MKIARQITVIILAMLPLLATAKGNESNDTISARRAFLEMPSGNMDLLSKSTRTEMLIYYDNDSIYKAPNNQGGTSQLTKVTPDFLEVELTPSSTLQMKVLKTKDGKDILMTVHTIGAPGDTRDSEIAFYDARLQPLPTEKIFPTPKLETFFDTKGYKTKMKEVEEILPFHAYFFEASAESPDLTGRLSYDDLLTVEDAGIIQLLVKPQVTFKWDGKRFKTAE